MAISDYILCSICQSKLVYDGDKSNRKWLTERFGTDDLYCPKCVYEIIEDIDKLSGNKKPGLRRVKDHP